MFHHIRNIVFVEICDFGINQISPIFVKNRIANSSFFPTLFTDYCGCLLIVVSMLIPIWIVCVLDKVELSSYLFRSDPNPSCAPLGSGLSVLELYELHAGFIF